MNTIGYHIKLHQKTKDLITSIAIPLFEISLLWYLLFYLIDDFFPGFVTTYLNLNILIFAIITSGIVVTMISPKREATSIYHSTKPNSISKKYVLLIVFLGMISSLLIYAKLDFDSWLRPTIAGLSGLIIIFLSILLLLEEDNPNP